MSTDYLSDEQIRSYVERIAEARGWPSELLDEVLGYVEAGDYQAAAEAVAEWGGDGAEKAAEWLATLAGLPDDYFDWTEEIVSTVTETAEDLASAARVGVPLGLVLGGAVLLWLLVGRRR